MKKLFIISMLGLSASLNVMNAANRFGNTGKAQTTQNQQQQQNNAASSAAPLQQTTSTPVAVPQQYVPGLGEQFFGGAGCLLDNTVKSCGYLAGHAWDFTKAAARVGGSAAFHAMNIPNYAVGGVNWLLQDQTRKKVIYCVIGAIIILETANRCGCLPCGYWDTLSSTVTSGASNVTNTTLQSLYSTLEYLKGLPQDAWNHQFTQSTLQYAQNALNDAKNFAHVVKDWKNIQSTAAQVPDLLEKASANASQITKLSEAAMESLETIKTLSGDIASQAMKMERMQNCINAMSVNAADVVDQCKEFGVFFRPAKEVIIQQQGIPLHFNSGGTSFMDNLSTFGSSIWSLYSNNQ